MEPVDLCNRCFKPISDQVPVVIRKDLANLPEEDYDDDMEEFKDE